MTYAFAIILFCHFMGDFVFQSNWMAQNKSKNGGALSYHVAVYSLVLFVCMYAVFDCQFVQLATFISVNAGIHWCTDAVTSRINSRLYGLSNKHYFFVCIGFDQFIHQLSLLLTTAWFFPVLAVRMM